MKLQRFLPAADLKSYVKGYWILNVEPGELEQPQFLFPVGAVEIIFHLQDGFYRINEGDLLAEHNAFIEGQQAGCLIVEQKGTIKTVGITLHPWATKYLWKTSPKTFTNNRYGISEIDKSLQELHEKLASLATNIECIKLCDDFLLKKLMQSGDVTESNHLFMNLFSTTADAGDIAELKKRWNYSTRYLEKKYIDLMGVTASEQFCKKRALAALKMLIKKDYTSLTAVAHQNEYYDQSHYIRAFRNYFSMTPREFINKDHLLLYYFS
ncbi:MAG TPA: DUF6597 domain-containing transcriptional factor [Chitinophagaceae bacterium]|nr:DUF6597 domain-containing transcriptional factor [Chitinophagaceae bacterium]